MRHDEDNEYRQRCATASFCKVLVVVLAYGIGGVWKLKKEK